MRVPTGHVLLPTLGGVVPQTAALGTLAGDGPQHLCRRPQDSRTDRLTDTHKQTYAQRDRQMNGTKNHAQSSL